MKLPALTRCDWCCQCRCFHIHCPLLNSICSSSGIYQSGNANDSLAIKSTEKYRQLQSSLLPSHTCLQRTSCKGTNLLIMWFFIDTFSRTLIQCLHLNYAVGELMLSAGIFMHFFFFFFFVAIQRDNFTTMQTILCGNGTL